MTRLKRFVFVSLTLVVFIFIGFYLFLVARDPQNYEPAFTNSAEPTVALLHSFQTAPFTLGRQVTIEGYEIATIGKNIEFDDALFNFDLEADQLLMTFDVGPQQRASSGSDTLAAGTYERFYLQFSGLTVVDAQADPTASLVPNVRWDGRTLLIEISEGMMMGEGQAAQIILETAVPETITTPIPVATESLDTIFIPADSDN